MTLTRHQGFKTESGIQPDLRLCGRLLKRPSSRTRKIRTQAHFRLVQSRIDELREFRLESLPTVGEFVLRRLSPINTCESVVLRQEVLAKRIARTNDLLRTLVSIAQEKQNQKILQARNARTAPQVRLQHAVEGLSVAAIPYYLLGPLTYACKTVTGGTSNWDSSFGVLIALCGNSA